MTVETSVPSFTCYLCQVVFKELDQQKYHFSSDWHRYNLKRKIAELPAVTREVFVERVLKQQQKNGAVETVEGSGSLRCEDCGKGYSSLNALENHLKSKKHRECVSQSSPNKDKPTSKQTESDRPNWKAEFAKVRSEEEMYELMEKKYRASQKLDERDCLFCSHRATCINSNLHHMSLKHSFFIPDVAFCSDVAGLLKYLGDKISVGNICIYCNGKGRQIYSLEAVRKHMIDLGHTKMDYSFGNELEYAEFYSYEDGSGEDWESVDSAESFEEVEDLDQGAQVVPLTGELVLPNGTRLGNRKFSKFYRQSLRDKVEKQSVVIKRLMENYKQLGQVQSTRLSKESRAIMAAEKVRRAVQIHEKLAISQKANNQAHFRPQVMY